MPHTLTARIAKLLAAAALVLALPAVAQTPPCGAQVAQSIRLNADMYCSNGYPALVVVADGVIIELDGHEIVGAGFLAGSTIVPGIRSQGYDKVQVVGPGVIRMWGWDIYIEGGRDHLVTGIVGKSLGGVSLTHTSDAMITNNALNGVSINSYANGTASGNQVYANRVGDPATTGFVALMGCNTLRNFVSGNEINGGVMADFGASRNLIDGNKILSPAFRDEAVLFGEAYGNQLSRNSIDAGGTIGVSVMPSAYPQYTCRSGAPGTNGDRNRVVDNSIRNATTAVRVGTLQPTAQTLGTENQINSNRIAGVTGRGLLFAPGSARNDGTGNTYANVPIPVEDFGSGNLWP